MLVQITHCGEVIETLRTADETGIEVGQHFRLMGQLTRFRCEDVNFAWPKMPVASGLTADGRRYTQARLADIIRVS